MKNILSAAILIFAIIFVGNNFANAQDVYVGVFPENGLNAYLVTETISKYSTGDSAGFSCKVKSVKNNGSFSYVDYKFITEPSWGITKNGVTLGQGQTGQLLRNKNSVEYNIGITILNIMQEIRSEFLCIKFFALFGLPR